MYGRIYYNRLTPSSPGHMAVRRRVHDYFSGRLGGVPEETVVVVVVGGRLVIDGGGGGGREGRGIRYRCMAWGKVCMTDRMTGQLSGAVIDMLKGLLQVSGFRNTHPEVYM